jgi:phage regulator Rha-like protein
LPATGIESAILLLRGQRVLLDADLAALYGVDARALKRAVRRNRARFPVDFMLELSPEEHRSLRCQFGALKRGQHAKYPPYAFTEQGVAMLSSVLRSERAILVNIAVMRAFVKLRETLAAHKELAQKLAELEQKIASHDQSIQTLFGAIRQLMSPPSPPRKQIGFSVREGHARLSASRMSAAARRCRVCCPRRASEG